MIGAGDADDIAQGTSPFPAERGQPVRRQPREVLAAARESGQTAPTAAACDLERDDDQRTNRNAVYFVADLDDLCDEFVTESEWSRKGCDPAHDGPVDVACGHGDRTNESIR